MAKKKGKGCLIAIAIFIGLSIIGGMAGNGDKKDTATTQPVKQEKKTDEVKEKTPEIKVTSVDISKAFHENELKGKDTYTGKYAEITGVVRSVGESIGRRYIVLQGDESDPSNIVDIQCYIDKDDEETTKKASALKKGQEVTLIGNIEEMSLNVSVKNTKIK